MVEVIAPQSGEVRYIATLMEKIPGKSDRARGGCRRGPLSVTRNTPIVVTKRVLAILLFRSPGYIRSFTLRSLDN